MQEKQVLIGFAIVVVDRGFVYVGQTEINGDWCVITDARNIRKWGTTRGLGQLAIDGPQAETVLDSAGTVRIPVATGALIHLLDTEESKWNLELLMMIFILIQFLST